MVETDVLIVGAGPAGAICSLLLGDLGVRSLMINKYPATSPGPRAHITNQRCMEVLRDLGRDVEDEAYMFATNQDLMGENVFCVSLAGEELGRPAQFPDRIYRLLALAIMEFAAVRALGLVGV